MLTSTQPAHSHSGYISHQWEAEEVAQCPFVQQILRGAERPCQRAGDGGDGTMQCSATCRWSVGSSTRVAVRTTLVRLLTLTNDEFKRRYAEMVAAMRMLAPSVLPGRSWAMSNSDSSFLCGLPAPASACAPATLNPGP